MIKYKICSRCRIPLLVIEFNKNRTKKDGYQHNCKSCKAIIYDNTRGRVLSKQKDYRANNSESISKKKKISYYKNKSKADSMKTETNKMFIKKLELIPIETIILLEITPVDFKFLWENQIVNVSNSAAQKDCYFVHTDRKKEDEGFVAPKNWFTFKNPKTGRNAQATIAKPVQPTVQGPPTEEAEKQKNKYLEIESRIKKKQEVLSALDSDILRLKTEKKRLQQAQYDLTFAIKQKKKKLEKPEKQHHPIAKKQPEETKLDEHVTLTEAIIRHHKREVELLEKTIDILEKCLFKKGKDGDWKD